MPDSSGFFDFYLTEISPKDKPWDKHRAEAQSVEKLYESGQYLRYAERIRQCSRFLGFKLSKPNESGEAKLKLDQTQFCRVRHCPVCQWRRSLMWYARFLKKLPIVMEKYPKCRWVFLTLTVKNCPIEDLRETVKHMNLSWKRLCDRKEFPGIGWVKSFEVTRGDDDTAHPHFHVLVMVRSSYFTHGYIKHDKWVELWRSCLRVNYSPSVHIRRVDYDSKSVTNTVNNNDTEKRLELPIDGMVEALTPAIMLAVLETMKYTVKPSDLLKTLDPVWLCELTKQLHKTRAIAIGGILREYFSEQETEQEMIEGAAEEQIVENSNFMAWFGWREMMQRYQAVERGEIKIVPASSLEQIEQNTNLV